MRTLLVTLCSLVLFSPLVGEEELRLLSLEQAERYALENNNEVKEMEQLLEKAKQGHLESISRWLPKLTAISQAYRTQIPPIPEASTTSSFLTQISLTQEIFSADAYYGVKLSELAEEQFSLLLDAATNDTLYALRRAYYKIALDQSLLYATEEQVRLLSELAKKMTSKYEVGEAILYDVNQSRVAITNATARYYQAVRDIKSDRDRLADVLGLDPMARQVVLETEDIPLEAIPDLAQKLREVEPIFAAQQEEGLIFEESFVKNQAERMGHLFTQEEIAHWEKLSEEYRPDLRVSENAVAIAAESIKLKQGEYLPSIRGVAGYGGAPTPYFFNLSDRLTNEQFHWGVGLELNWMLFDGLGRERRIKRAKAEKSAKWFGYQKSLQAAHTEVRYQIYEIEEAISRYLTSSANVKLAEKTVQLALDQLEVGYITIFDYLISIDSLTQARNICAQSRYDLLIAYYGLRHAAGIH